MALSNPDGLISLMYDPAIYGLDNSFWKTTLGVPSVVANKIRLSNAAIYSNRTFKFGSVKFAWNVAVAPTAGQTRSWGLALPSGVEKAIFSVAGAVFSVITTDSAGTSKTTVVPFTGAWATAETKYEIVWSNAPASNSVNFLVNGVSVATHTVNLPKSALFAFISNGTVDNSDLGLVTISNTQLPYLPIDKSDTNFLGYEALKFTITGAQTNYDVGSNQATLFVHPYRQMTVKVSVASTVRLNTTSMGAIAMGTGEIRTIDKFTTTDAFITTTGDTDVTIDGWY